MKANLLDDGVGDTLVSMRCDHISWIEMLPRSGGYGALALSLGDPVAWGLKRNLSRIIDRMIASLLSDDNRWINAERIEVTGGYV